MTITIWPLPALSVHLSEIELTYSEYVATMRLADVERHRRKNRADLVIGDSERANHMLGALGEHAFAKWLGVPRAIDGQWGVCPACGCFAGTVNTFKTEGDVGRYQVRTRSHPNSPLIIRDDDADDDVFVLVTVWSQLGRNRPKIRLALAVGDGVYDNFTVAGWITAGDAKQWGWRRDPQGRGSAYFIPQENLRPIISLPIDSARTKGADADGDRQADHADRGTDAEPRTFDPEQVRGERPSSGAAEGATIAPSDQIQEEGS